MSFRIDDILKQKNFDQPPEVGAIKDYVQKNYKADCSVMVKDDTVVIVVPSAALAGTLRMELLALQKAAQTKKRLAIRIG